MSVKSGKQFNTAGQLTLRAMTSAADKLKKEGKLPEATDLYLQGIEDREHFLGPDHPETYDIVFVLGQLYETRRMFTEAEAQYTRVLIGREKMLGAHHPTACEAAYTLGNMFRKLTQYKKAVTMFEFAYKGYQKTYGDSHEKTIKMKELWEEVVKQQNSSVCIIS